MIYYSETLKIQAGVGSFKAVPKKQKSSQKKEFLLWSTTAYLKNCSERTALG